MHRLSIDKLAVVKIALFKPELVTKIFFQSDHDGGFSQLAALELVAIMVHMSFWAKILFTTFHADDVHVTTSRPKMIARILEKKRNRSWELLPS